MKYKAVIFDMDGTILNTTGDLGDSMNHVLEELGHKHDFTEQDAGQFFGSGVRVACKRALSLECGYDYAQLMLIGTENEVLPETVTEEEVNKVEQAFAAYYPDHCRIRTAPYDGIPDLLRKLSANGCKLAVASNKINVAVQELASEMFSGLFDRAIGVDETIRRKPHPDMLLQIMEEFGVTADETVLIGDTEIDVITAGNAGIDCICVEWGFRTAEYMKSQGVSCLAATADDVYKMIAG